jgi:hypothetical protein
VVFNIFRLFGTPPEFTALQGQVGALMITQAQLVTQLAAFTASLGTAKTSIQGKIQALTDQLANAGNLTPEAEAALTDLAAAVAAIGSI